MGQARGIKIDEENRDVLLNYYFKNEVDVNAQFQASIKSRSLEKAKIKKSNSTPLLVKPQKSYSISKNPSTLRPAETNLANPSVSSGTINWYSQNQKPQHMAEKQLMEMVDSYNSQRASQQKHEYLDFGYEKSKTKHTKRVEYHTGHFGGLLRNLSSVLGSESQKSHKKSSGCLSTLRSTFHDNMSHVLKKRKNSLREISSEKPDYSSKTDLMRNTQYKDLKTISNLSKFPKIGQSPSTLLITSQTQNNESPGLFPSSKTEAKRLDLFDSRHKSESQISQQLKNNVSGTPQPLEPSLLTKSFNRKNTALTNHSDNSRSHLLIHSSSKKEETSLVNPNSKAKISFLINNSAFEGEEKSRKSKDFSKGTHGAQTSFPHPKESSIYSHRSETGGERTAAPLLSATGQNFRSFSKRPLQMSFHGVGPNLAPKPKTSVVQTSRNFHKINKISKSSKPKEALEYFGERGARMNRINTNNNQSFKEPKEAKETSLPLPLNGVSSGETPFLSNAADDSKKSLNRKTSKNSLKNASHKELSLPH